MDNLVTEARKYMSSDEGKDMMNKFDSNQQGQADQSESSYKPVQGGSGSNSFPSGEPQYGQGSNTENQYSAQNDNKNNNNDNNNNNDDKDNQGNEAKGRAGQAGGQGQGQGQGVNQFKGGESDYDGYEQGDSSATGGWGANKGGDSFARANQLGAETEGPFTSDPKSNRNALDAHQSGTSTPAYAEEDDMDTKRPTQGGNGSSGLNPYGNNEDDVQGSEGNPYHEQGRRL